MNTWWVKETLAAVVFLVVFGGETLAAVVFLVVFGGAILLGMRGC